MDTPTKQPNRQPRPKLWTPIFILIVGLALCGFIAGQGLNAGTSVYIDRLGGTATYSGLLATVFSVAAAITRLACGPLVDSKGRAITMTIGAVFLVVGTAGPAIFGDISAFIVYRFLQGIGFSAVTTAAATAAADVLPYSRLGEGIGYYGLGQALAMSVGPALALFLVATDAPNNLYIGLTAISVVVLILSLFCRYERNPESLPETSVYRMRREAQDSEPQAEAAKAAELSTGKAAVNSSTDAADPNPSAEAETEPAPKGFARLFERRALPGALPMIVLSPAFGFGIFFVGLFGTSIGIDNAGLFFTLSAVSMIAVRLKSNSYMDRVAPIKVFAVSVACGVVAYLLLLASETSSVFYYVAGLFYGMCLGISMPINQSVAVKNTPAERWGAANALYMLATDVGVGVASVIWGVINDTFGFTTTIWCVIACIALSFAVAWAVYPKEAKRSR